MATDAAPCDPHRFFAEFVDHMCVCDGELTRFLAPLDLLKPFFEKRGHPVSPANLRRLAEDLKAASGQSQLAVNTVEGVFRKHIP